MSRPLYHAEVIDARAVLDPSGDHRLRIETDNGIMIVDYDAGQVKQLEAAIEQFKSLTLLADGGPDFHNRKVIPVEVRR